MFTRCIHCSGDLGANEAIEHFAVGRKLAFDSERGRLWVICPHCSRWNLTPIEERWEAVEECERAFRGQRLRAQTSNIGYAALRDGTGLVRIGRPLRPEFAAWRYGREFSRRRTRALVGAGTLGFAGAGLLLGSAYVAGAIVLPGLSMFMFNVIRALNVPRADFELPRGPGRSWTVSGGRTMILPDGDAGWYLSLRHHFGDVEYRGAEARRMLATVLARVNRAGGSDGLVRDAVTVVEQRPTEALLREVAEQSGHYWAVDGPELHRREREPMGNDPAYMKNRAGLTFLEPARRLALEMALHEHTEQRALEGEMAELETAWREAEEIAGIADDLLLPPGTEQFLEENRPGEGGRHVSGRLRGGTELPRHEADR